MKGLEKIKGVFSLASVVNEYGLRFLRDIEAQRKHEGA